MTPKLAASVVDDCIAVWRRARLSSDTGGLGLPGINVIHESYYVNRKGDADPLDDPAVEAVQEIVDDMPPEERAAFEAYHLGLVNGEWWRDKPHWRRAHAIGIDMDIYRVREQTGWNMIADGLRRAFFP